jgi:hypothetical protein
MNLRDLNTLPHELQEREDKHGKRDGWGTIQTRNALLEISRREFSPLQKGKSAHVTDDYY